MASPMYRQIAEAIRAQIEAGELEPGQQLRTELELREHYHASRNTVRDAIKWLSNLGLVETKPGQGTFVVQEIDPFVTKLSGDPLTGIGSDEGANYLSEATEQNRKPTSSPLQVEIQEASDQMAAALQIPTGAEIISRHERRFIDGLPWSMQTSFYPMEFADRGAERLRSIRNISEGTIRYLADTLHIRQVGYRDRITVRAPNAVEADFFKLSSDGRVPMYEITRTAYDGNGQPMRVTVTVYPADRNQFVVNVGQVPNSTPLDDDLAPTRISYSRR
jgi:DNA-binding GntR family transcriptional regulator